MGVFLSTARSKELQPLDYVRVQPRVAHRVMIDENLKAKELYTASTKKDPLYGCQDASSRASSMSRLFRDTEVH